MTLTLDGLDIGHRSGRHRHTVLAGLHATAAPGELTVLIGPNGAGKSTLLRTAAGLLPPLAGTVRLDGVDLLVRSPSERARQVAVVLTDRVEPGLLTARELVGLGRLPHTGPFRRPGPADIAAVDRALDATDATRFADRRVAELSDGERQRVLTARALAQAPQVLLLDEPGAFLDVAARVGLLALLRDLARTEKMCVVASTHDLELALRLADTVWLVVPAGGSPRVSAAQLHAGRTGGQPEYNLVRGLPAGTPSAKLDPPIPPTNLRRQPLVGADGELRTGTPEELAAAGHIGAVFDTPALAFDAESGTFAGTGAPGPTVRVRGEHAAMAGRALRREGWTPVSDGPADAEITGRAQGFRAQSAGATTQLAGWAELGEWARTTAVAPPRRAGDAEVAAALDAAAAVGPYFAVQARDGAEWIALDAAGVATLTDTVGERLGTTERRVAASIMFQGLAARLVSPVLAGLGHGIVLDLDPAATEVRCRAGEAMGLTCAQVGGWLAPEPDVVLVAEVLLEQQLRPLVEAVAADGPVAEGLLWGNAASALVGALTVLGGGSRSVAARVVAELLDHGPLAGTGNFGPGGFRRRSCCLFYRTPAGGYCGDCALVNAGG